MNKNFQIIWKRWTKFLNGEYYLVTTALILVMTLVCFIFLHSKDPWDVAPIFFISCLALGFSYFAYKHTKEKFRLDLYERRLQYNDDLVIFLSDALNSDLSQSKKDELANKCVQGLGIHRARTLFDKNVNEYVDSIFNSYKYFKSHGGLERIYYSDAERNEYSHHLRIIQKAPIEIQEVLKPYLYFGGYKNNNA